ncbi:MAG: YlxR family protein [Eggerthellaceae bacterium]|nr:YlxR family protein [Eggerthellaceae bacterium]
MAKRAQTGKRHTAHQQRSCIACRARRDKAKLFRLVRDSAQAVHFDSTGRIDGRGAYVCSLACMETAQKTRRLERALRVPITHEDYSRITAAVSREYAASIQRIEESL